MDDSANNQTGPPVPENGDTSSRSDPSDESQPEASESPSGDGDSDSFNQDDIDALMASAGGEANPSEPAPAADAAASGPFNQSEIDALLNGDAVEPPAAETVAQESAPDTRVDTLGRPFDEAAAAMQAAMDEEKAAAVSSATQTTSSTPSTTQQPQLQELGGGEAINAQSKRVTMLSDVNLRVKLQLGQTRMLVEDVLKLGEGSVVELDKLAGDPVDVLVNDRLIARGEVLVLNDSFCVRISEVLSNDPHRITN